MSFPTARGIHGADHLLVMVAAGVLAAIHGRRATLTLPALFIATMLVGGVIALFAIPVPHFEFGIKLSVLALGLALASGRKIPVWFAEFAIATFGFLHGVAHGCEIPSMASPWGYVAGFTLVTALLHVSGVLAGVWASQTRIRQVRLRLAGVAMTLLGVVMFFVP